MSALTSTDFRHGWANFGPLADENTRKGELVELPASEKLSVFLQHALRYQFETCYIQLVGSATHQVRVSSQSGHPDLLYSQEWVNVIFLHLWPQKSYGVFRFGTLWPILCSYPRHSQLTRHSLMLANGRIKQSLTALAFIYHVSHTGWLNHDKKMPKTEINIYNVYLLVHKSHWWIGHILIFSHLPNFVITIRSNSHSGMMKTIEFRFSM